MIRIITFLALFVVAALTAQTNYEKDMQQALSLWKEGKTKKATALFQQIADVETEKWLPNYYVALLSAQQVFLVGENREEMQVLLETAQKYQDIVNRTEMENPEAMVVQALIHTGWIVYAPMFNGQRLLGDVLFLYEKAYKLAPENPRVVLNKAHFEMGKARYFGQDTTAMCVEIAKSISLFSNFKPESSLSPNWGLDLAEAALAECTK